MIIALLALFVLVATGLTIWWRRRARARHAPVVSPPPMIFISPITERDPLDDAIARRATPPAPRRTVPRAPAIGIMGDGASGGSSDGVIPNGDGPGTGVPPGLAGGDGRVATSVRRSPTQLKSVTSAAQASAVAGTLRMLPGRLEFVEGPLAGGDVRFVHSGVSAEQRITLGRGEGPPYEHVQIASQTVSRMHAAMTFREGRWTIANLSATNPLRVNGLELSDRDTAVPLSDGDTVELGDVVLRFRA